MGDGLGDKGFVEFFANEIAVQAAAPDKVQAGDVGVGRVLGEQPVLGVVAVEPALGGEQ